MKKCKKYLLKISDLRHGVVSTISEIYRNYYNPATKSNVATISNATRSIIVKENTISTNESKTIASMSDAIKGYEKDIKEKDDIIKDYEEQIDEYKKQLETYIKAIDNLTNPQNETKTQSNVLIPAKVGN